MVVLFRLVWALVTSRFRPNIDPLAEASLPLRVWPNDLDLNMHVSSGRYLSFMDIGRVELFARMRVMRRIFSRGWRPINAGTMITYRKSLLLFDRFIVRSKVACWDEKWMFFEHVIERPGGELVARATARGLLRGPQGNIPTSEVLDAVGRAGAVSPPIPPHIARWMEAEAAR